MFAAGIAGKMRLVNENNRLEAFGTRHADERHGEAWGQLGEFKEKTHGRDYYTRRGGGVVENAP
jgi:hypothetical protein